MRIRAWSSQYFSHYFDRNSGCFPAVGGLFYLINSHFGLIMVDINEEEL